VKNYIAQIKKTQSEVSEAYATFGEDFINKRIKSEFPIRAKVHSLMHKSILRIIPGDCESAIDLGCGDGSLTFDLLDSGLSNVRGADVSKSNIQRAKHRQTKKNYAPGQIDFDVQDVTSTKYKDKSFDISITSHVLEHLEDFDSGLKEQKRLAKKYVIVALPTAWSPLSWTLLGGGNYWKHGKLGFIRLTVGLLRVIVNFVLNKIGVDEKNYSGLSNVPHIFFFPKRVAKKMQCDEWVVIKMYPQVNGLPWNTQSIRILSHNSISGLGTIFILARRRITEQ
jgi:ubiquinone/menaquinone biosynthesis C-methylase UbiE